MWASDDAGAPAAVAAGDEEGVVDSLELLDNNGKGGYLQPGKKLSFSPVLPEATACLFAAKAGSCRGSTGSKPLHRCCTYRAQPSDNVQNWLRLDWSHGS